MNGTPSIRLDVLCNNPDNGLFAHRADGLQVTTWDGEGVEFFCQRVRAPRFVEINGGFQFMRRKWSILRSKEWYGNWCWNAYWLTVSDTIDLLARVHASGMFDCEHGPSPMFDNWRAPEFNRVLWTANLWGRHSIGVVA